MKVDNRTKDKILQRLKDDFTFFVEKSLFIIDKKTNKLVRFKLNKIQRYFLDNRDRFTYIIKSRKGGISTISIAYMLWRCAFYQNQKAVMLCQNDDATFKMFRERVIPMINNSAFPIKCKIKESQGIIDFPDTNSSFYIGTAGSKSFGRGSDITYYHLSEYAHWDDSEVLTGIEEALVEGAEGVIETTANGINFAHNLWKKAIAGEARYKAVFIPWFFDEAYQLPGVVALPEYTPEEKELQEAFDVTAAQLAWRRAKIKNMSDPEKFPQEYPATAEEAFISSGKMVFDWVSLKKHEVRCEPPKAIGFIKDDGPHGMKFEVHKTGSLKIWAFPVPDRNYIIGADIAEGIEGGAYSAAFVLDLSTMAQVAEWHGHIAPDDFGEVLNNLGYYYNTALLAPEAWPGVGNVTINKLIQLEYPNLYKREKKKSSNRTEEQLYGWATNTETKPLMVHSLGGSGIRDFELTIRSVALLDEMRSFVYDEKNPKKMGPQTGCFSDRVIACAIAWHIAKSLGLDEKEETQQLNFYFKNKHLRGRIKDPKFKGSKYGVREV